MSPSLEAFFKSYPQIFEFIHRISTGYPQASSQAGCGFWGDFAKKIGLTTTIIQFFYIKVFESSPCRPPFCQLGKFVNFV